MEKECSRQSDNFLSLPAIWNHRNRAKVRKIMDNFACYVVNFATALQANCPLALCKQKLFPCNSSISLCFSLSTSLSLNTTPSLHLSLSMSLCLSPSLLCLSLPSPSVALFCIFLSLCTSADSGVNGMTESMTFLLVKPIGRCGPLTDTILSLIEACYLIETHPSPPPPVTTAKVYSVNLVNRLHSRSIPAKYPRIVQV